MYSSDFRQITVKSRTDKAERLFRAAVSAFCCLTRPSRAETAQLEDLTLPLFDQVSDEAKRYVAAALSESPGAPLGLVKRLVDESVDIAAPLLVRSPVLADADLVALIGRHGYAHARAIGRRPGLNPAIASLVSMIERKVVPLRQPSAPAASTPPRDASHEGDASPTIGAAGSRTLRRLRSMMEPASALISTSRVFDGSGTGPDHGAAYERIRETVLTGRPAFFQTALADALAKDFASVRETSTSDSYDWLLDALRLLDIGDEKAFLVTAAFYPSFFTDLDSIRIFLLRYATIDRREAQRRVASWRAGAHDLTEREVEEPAGIRAAG